MVKVANKDYEVFPQWFVLNQRHQMERAGLVRWGTSNLNDGYLCRDCEKKGKGNFVCKLCGETKTSDKIKEEFGHEGNFDFLCKDCYDNKSAKEWADKNEELRSNHVYDYY